VLALVLAAALALGNSAVEAWARHQLGTHAIGAGQTSEAVRFLREALEMRRRQGDVVGAAYTQHNLDLLLPPAPPPDGGQPDGQPVSPGPSFGRGIVLGMIAGVIAMGIFALAIQPPPDDSALAASATSLPTMASNTPSATPLPPVCPRPPGWVDYVVATGEIHLLAIADKFGTPMIGLIIANCLSGPELTPGQILAVPPVTPTPTATNTPTATATPSHTPTPCGPPAGWLVYFIQAQDTLFSLARNTGTTLQQLKLANCLAADTIYVGQVLYVPRLPPTRTFTPSPTPTPTSTPTDTSTPTVTPSPTCAPPPQGWVTYVVQKGDTLPSLAQSLHTTEYMLRLANCLQSDILIPGQLLYVPRLPAGGTTPPPRITGIRIIAYSAKPEQSYYGSGTALICPTAIVAFRVTIDHPENAAEVTIVYRYEAAGAYEPWRTARAARDSGDVFSARIDNNANDQARQALDNQDGRIRWYVRAVDRDGVQYDTSDVETPLKYCDDSGF
jgi:LysM repeat protein